jgi:hypothetical protein
VNLKLLVLASVGLVGCVGLGPAGSGREAGPVVGRSDGPAGFDNGSYGTQAAIAPPTVFAPTGKPGQFIEQVDVSVFQKGNLHTHSTNSDGDSPPEAIYAWYRDHGYNFLGLSDHNRLTDPALYRNLERPGFVIIPAEEVTLRPNKIPVHVNALCERERIGGNNHVSDIPQALQWAVGRILQQGGVALINHPNFKWAFGPEMLPYGRGAQLLEIWSGHPAVHPMGDASHPTEEAIWDAALTNGLDFAPAAVDDMHFLGSEADGGKPGPGRGWVEVFAAHANVQEICTAMLHRQLLASNGAHLRRLRVAGDAMEISPDTQGTVVDFIGRTGALLSRVTAPPDGTPVVYRLRGGEGYVRARTTATNGAHAWTPAYRVSDR